MRVNSCDAKAKDKRCQNTFPLHDVSCKDIYVPQILLILYGAADKSRGGCDKGLGRCQNSSIIRSQAHNFHGLEIIQSCHFDDWCLRDCKPRCISNMNWKYGNGMIIEKRMCSESRVFSVRVLRMLRGKDLLLVRRCSHLPCLRTQLALAAGPKWQQHACRTARKKCPAAPRQSKRKNRAERTRGPVRTWAFQTWRGVPVLGTSL